MFGFIERFKAKYRKHEFDLDKPYKIEKFLVYKFPVYKCKNCDKTLALDLWQMERLPPNMARGCKKRR